MTDQEKAKAKLVGDLRDADRAHKDAQKKADSFGALCDTIATKLAREHKMKAIKINGRAINIAIKNAAERRAAKAANATVPEALYTLSEPRERAVFDGDALEDAAE